MKFLSATSVLVLGMMLIAGCSSDSDKSTIMGLKRSDSDALSAQNGKFETVRDPEFNPETHFAAGQLAESQNAPRRAIEQYKAALKIKSDHLPSLFRMGVVYAQNQMFTEAIETWKQYVKATNDDVAAYASLGYCYELAGKPADAEEAYKKGIARDGKNNLCRTNYGLLLARLGRTNEAIIQLQVAVPEAQVHYNLGSVHEQAGRKEEAKAEYRKAMAIDPTLTDAKARLAALE